MIQQLLNQPVPIRQYDLPFQVIPYSFLVERVLDGIGQGNETKFNDVPQLSNRLIYGVEFYTATQYAKTTSNASVVTTAGATGLTLILSDGETEFVYAHPSYNFVPSFNGGYWRSFNPRIIDFTRSYVKVNDPTNLVAGQAVALNFYYRM